MKKLIYIIPVALLLASCGTTRTSSTAGNSTPTVKRTKHSNPKFIESISMTPGEEAPGSGNNPNTGALSGPGEYYSNGVLVNIENSTDLHFKYAVLLDRPVESLTNLGMLQFIEDWYGTRYRYGGNDKRGVDCSGFTCAMSSTVFGKTLPRTSREQYDRAQKIPAEYLQEGDLVFFNTTGGVSHVGIYLSNNKFVHASTSSGVVISDLNEDYYRRRFIGAGRL
ncbi:C40 family peptidase [Flavihumibacter stibioxidans]|uniref:C40 family peptidase n=1 Tax=Flavihumibacter stibioxidans TaxID=1834163 RepID=UPI001FE4D120|nr:NlpC/P60 family protein [Flavihumibacter stibioxidans]